MYHLSIRVTGLLASVGALAAMAFIPQAHADTVTVTVDGHDYPMCAVEDCSDQPHQTGVWENDGRMWLIVGDDTYPIYRGPTPPPGTVKL